jgi:hypothetical protein
MDTKTLARHYDALTAAERMALELSALGRGDRAEHERLARSAPRVAMAVPHTFGLYLGLLQLGTLHLLEQLHWGAVCWQSALVRAEADRDPGGRSGGVPAFAASRMIAYRCLVHAEGWRLFCGELGIDPDVLLRDLPGFDEVRRLHEQAREVAYTEAEARTFLRRAYRRRDSAGAASAEPGQSPEPETAAGVAASMRRFLRDTADDWS